MLADPRAGSLVDGFAEQWLTLRRLAIAAPDRERFPAFDARLREDMLRETQMFFESVMAEDRSVLDFVDGPFTYVNERLARHYGIAGVAGERFRRVALDGTARAGIFTQASVLTVTSYPDPDVAGAARQVGARAGARRDGRRRRRRARAT